LQSNLDQDTKQINIRIINQKTTCTAIVTKPSRTVTANIAPYWLVTGTASLLTNGTRIRLAAPVTQTPSTAVPLGVTKRAT